MKYTDKARIGIANYEIQGDRMHCTGKIYFGHSYDVHYNLRDLSAQTHKYGLRHQGFGHFLVLLAVFSVASVVCALTLGLSDVFWFLVTMVLCMAISTAWASSKVWGNQYIFRDGRPAFFIRICKESKPFVEYLDASIMASTQPA